MAGRRRPLVRLLGIGVSVAVVLVVLAVAFGIRGHDTSSGAAVPRVLPFGSTLNPSGPTGVIASGVQLAAVVPDPEGSGPAWGIKTYRIRGDQTCFQVGRERSGRIGAVGAYGSFGDDGRFHPFTFSDVGFGTCVPTDADQHAFDNVAYANATDPRPRRCVPDRRASRPGDLRHPMRIFRRRRRHRDEPSDRPDRDDHLPRRIRLPRPAADK